MKKLLCILCACLTLTACGSGGSSDKETSEYEVLDKAIETFDKNMLNYHSTIENEGNSIYVNGDKLGTEDYKGSGFSEQQVKDNIRYTYYKTNGDVYNQHWLEKCDGSMTYSISFTNDKIDPKSYSEYKSGKVETNPIRDIKSFYLEDDFKPFFDYSVEDTENGYKVIIKCTDLEGYQDFIDEINKDTPDYNPNEYAGVKVSKNMPLRQEYVFVLNSDYELLSFEIYSEHDYGDNIIQRSNSKQEFKKLDKPTYSIEEIEKILEENKK